MSAVALENVPDFSRCASPAYRSQGFFVLGAALVVVVAAAALAVIVPRAELRPLRREEKRLRVMPQVITRFGSWCDAVGLSGRRRPQLAVSVREVNEPSTIAVLGRRTIVVVPAAILTAEDWQGQFDAAVCHEMAHVQHGDARWASSVRWIGWITIPAVILACLPDILGGSGTQVPGELLVRACAFAVLAVVVAVWLLRRRELEADQQAVQWLGSPLPLQQLLETGLGSSRGRIRWPPRLLARHPSIPARITALQDRDDLSDGGLGYALVTGVVAAMAMNASYYVTSNLDYIAGGWLPTRVSAGVAATLFGFALTPSLIRRATRALLSDRQAAWWRPALGAATGVLLGSAVAPAPVPGAAAVWFIPGLASRHAVVASLLIACAGAGITAVAAGLATLAAGNRLRPWWTWQTAGSIVAIACCTAVVLWPITNLAAGGQLERAWLMFILPADRWRWLALSYPTMALLLMIRVRTGPADAVTSNESTSRGRARAPEIVGQRPRGRVAAALVPICAAAVAVAVLLPHSYPPAGTPAAAVLRVVEERWWALTLAGWVVLVILTLAGGIASLARACVSAWATCLLAGAGITAYGALTGHPGGPEAFASSVTTPSVWLFYLAVPTACFALLRPEVDPFARRSWALPALAAVGAAAAAVLVVFTGIPDLLVPLNPIPVPQPSPSHSARSPQQVTPTPPHSPASSQVLTQAGELHVISAAAAALPTTWLVSKAPSATTPVGQVTISPAACQPLANAEYLNVLPRRRARKQAGSNCRLRPSRPEARPLASKSNPLPIQSPRCC